MFGLILGQLKVLGGRVGFGLGRKLRRVTSPNIPPTLLTYPNQTSFNMLGVFSHIMALAPMLGCVLFPSPFPCDQLLCRCLLVGLAGCTSCFLGFESVVGGLTMRTWKNCFGDVAPVLVFLLFGGGRDD